MQLYVDLIVVFDETLVVRQHMGGGVEYEQANDVNDVFLEVSHLQSPYAPEKSRHGVRPQSMLQLPSGQP